MVSNNDELPPGVDVSVAPNYQDGCVWVDMSSFPRQCIPPTDARELANQIEDANLEDKTDGPHTVDYEHPQLVAYLREFADRVEGRSGDHDE